MIAILSLCAAVAGATSASAPSSVILSPVAVEVRSWSAILGESAILRLRGGVREIEDMDDWETVVAEAEDRLLVIDFTATWCGPCQRIAPAYAALAEEYADVAVFVKVDVDRVGELAAELGVTSMPTFLFFRSGEMIDSMRGADEEGLRALVAEHAQPKVAA